MGITAELTWKQIKTPPLSTGYTIYQRSQFRGRIFTQGTSASGVNTSMTLETKAYPMCYENDPEIMTMSEDERRTLALSAFGMWADDEDTPDAWDEWREMMTKSSWERIERVLNDTNKPNDSV